MARMPAAEWVGPHHDNGVMARWDVVCVHTIVGYAPAHAAHFSTKAGGTIYQSRDTNFQSAANLYGNPRVIAIENEDHGSAFGPWSGSDVPPLTDLQVEAIAKICAWAYETHGIPLVACPDSKPGSRGIGYHRQGIDGNWAGYAYGGRVAGGELWSGSTGKVCPGDKRISQLPQIITRARQIAGLEDDMAKFTDRHAAILDMLDEAFRANPDNPAKRGYLRTLIQEIVEDTREIDARLSNPPRLADIEAKIDALAAAVAKLPASVWATDNVVKNPYDNPKNPGWQAGNAVEHVLLQVIAIKDEVKKLSGGQS